MADQGDEYEGLRQHEINQAIDKSGETLTQARDSGMLRHNISNSSYTRKQLERLLHSLPVGDVKMSDLVTWTRVWKSRCDNVNLIHQPQSENHLNHAIWLLNLSIHLYDEGWDIHLIESVDCADIRKLKDIDLLISRLETYNLDGSKYEYKFTKDNKKIKPDKDKVMNKRNMMAIDYTNSNSMDENFNSIDDYSDCDNEWAYYHDGKVPLLQSKIDKMKLRLPFVDSYAVVKALNKQPLKINIDMSDKYESSRSDDIIKANAYIEKCLDFTVSDVKSLLHISADRLSLMEIDESQIVQLDPLDNLYDATLCSEALKNNDGNSLEYLNVINSTVTDPNIRDSYSLDELSRFKYGKVKPTLYTPLIRRHPGEPMKNKQMECSNMICRMANDDKELPAMSLAISLCVDNLPHPTPMEVEKYRRNVTDPRWGTFVITRHRCTSDIDLAHMYTLTVDDSYSDTNTFFMGGERKKPDRKILDYNGYLTSDQDIMSCPEEYLTGLSKSFYNCGDTSGYSEVMTDLVNDSMHTGEVSDMMRGLAHSTISFLDGSLSSYFEGHQNVALSALHLEKVSSNYKLSSSRPRSKSRHTTELFVNNVAGRDAMIICTASYRHSRSTDCSMTVEGNLEKVDNSGLLISKHHTTYTRWFNLSRTDLDWSVKSYSTIHSYLTLLCDTHIANKGPDYDLTLYKDCVFGSFLMAFNNTRFCQYINTTNTRFKNSVGISNSTSQMYEKGSWYEPVRFLERLYCLRLLKMTVFLQLMKANEDLPMAMESVDSTYVGAKYIHGNEKMVWKVAMPASSTTYNSMMSMYNLSNVGYAFSKTRHNLDLLQAQVLNKQLKSRTEYVSYRKNPRPTDMCNLPNPDDVDVYNLFSENLFIDTFGGQHKPCHLTVMLGSMSSIIDVHKMWEENNMTVRSIVDMFYKSADIFHNIKIHDVINNKASVADYGKGGVLPPKEMLKTVRVPVDKKNRKGPKKEKVVPTVVNQSLKAYETIFIAMHNYLKDIKPTKETDRNDTVSDEEYEKPKLEDEHIYSSMRSSNVMWPLLFFLLDNHSSMVARMIHKDDQKPREIAIMNIALRLVALFIETMARAVQKVEHDAGDKTNIIENPKKDDIVVKTYNEHKALWNEGMRVMFDNEDKSGWGPHQDEVVHYITLRFRCTSCIQSDLLSTLCRAFMTKIFKVPDNIYMKMKTMDQKRLDNPKNDITKACSALSQDIDGVYNFERGYIYADEGMFQGTESVSSSCGASDCGRLSGMLNSIILEEFEFRSVFHATSDDSIRCMSYRCEREEAEDILRRSLSVHTIISNNYSYKRNISDSVQTPFVAELNSIDHTTEGRIVPSIKSRLSFINYYYEPDMYLSASNIITQTAEYIRLESSVMGAYWIMLLQTLNHMVHFGLIGMYKKLGKDIFNKPLELGGIPKIDPVMTVCGSTHSNFLDNYGGSFPMCITMMNDVYRNPSNILHGLSQEERHIYKIRQDTPKFSRSNVTNIANRDKKEKRLIRELVMKLPEKEFTNLMYPGQSPLKALISSFSRETTYYQESSSSLRYKAGNTPMDANIYYVKSSYFSVLGYETRVSRRDILSFCSQMKYTDDGIEYKGHITPVEKTKNDVSEYCTEIHDSYIKNITTMRIDKIVPHPKSSTKIRVADYRTTAENYQREIQKFEEDNLPVLFGGSSEIHPIIYLEALETFKSKTKKFTSRIQKLYSSVDSSLAHVSIEQQLLSTDFIEGSKIVSKEIKRPNRNNRKDHYLNKMKGWLKDKKRLALAKTLKLKDLIEQNQISEVIDISVLTSFHVDVTVGHEVDPVVLKESCNHLWNADKNENLKFYSKKVQYVIERPLYPSRSVIYRCNDINVRQMPLVNNNGCRSTEINVEIGREFHHYVTIWNGNLQFLLDTDKDKYHYVSLEGVSKIPIFLGDLNGIMCFMYHDHPVMLLDQNKSSLDAVPTTITTNGQLITQELVERHMMEDVDSRRILDDLNRYTTDIDFNDDIDLTQKRLDAMGKIKEESKMEVDNGDFSVNSDEEQSIFDMIDLLNRGVRQQISASSDQSSLTGSHMSRMTNQSETDDSELSHYRNDNYGDEDYMPEDTIATTIDNSMYPSSEIVNIIRNEKFHAPQGPLLGMSRALVKRQGYRPYEYTFGIKLFPDMPLEIKQSFHKDDEIILHMLDAAERHYGQSHRYKFFKAYLLSALVNTFGMSLIVQYRKQIRQKNQLDESRSLDSISINSELDEDVAKMWADYV